MSGSTEILSRLRLRSSPPLILVSSKRLLTIPTKMKFTNTGTLGCVWLIHIWPFPSSPSTAPKLMGQRLTPLPFNLIARASLNTFLINKHSFVSHLRAFQLLTLKRVLARQASDEINSTGTVFWTVNQSIMLYLLCHLAILISAIASILINGKTVNVS